MENASFIQSLTKFLKEQGLIGVMCLLLVYFLGTFTTQLTDIQKELIDMKITLAKMQQKYAEKAAVREYVQQQFAKHIQMFHNGKNSNN